jgi:predicted esterase
MERVKTVPIRFYHGSTDVITPVDNSRELEAALRAVGANARYEEIAGAGHGIRDQVYTHENFLWLLQQKRPD